MTLTVKPEERGITKQGTYLKESFLKNSGALTCLREEEPVGSQILKIGQREGVIDTAWFQGNERCILGPRWRER